MRIQYNCCGTNSEKNYCLPQEGCHRKRCPLKQWLASSVLGYSASGRGDLICLDVHTKWAFDCISSPGCPIWAWKCGRLLHEQLHCTFPQSLRSIGFGREMPYCAAFSEPCCPSLNHPFMRPWGCIKRDFSSAWLKLSALLFRWCFTSMGTASVSAALRYKECRLKNLSDMLAVEFDLIKQVPSAILRFDGVHRWLRRWRGIVRDEIRWEMRTVTYMDEERRGNEL